MPLGVPVLRAFQSIQYRTESCIAGAFVLFDASSLARYLRHATGQAGAAPGSQDAPRQGPVDVFELW